MPVGLRSRVPAKMTSSILMPRRLFADCSPSTQVMASEMLDFAAAVGSDDGGDAFAGQLNFGAIAEGLEAEDLDLFELEHAVDGLGDGESCVTGGRRLGWHPICIGVSREDQQVLTLHIVDKAVRTQLMGVESTLTGGQPWRSRFERTPDRRSDP